MTRIIHRAIRIITDDGTGTRLPITDASRGILNGEFHFITDQTTFLNDQTLSGDGIITSDDQYWYPKFITKDSVGNPVRMVDIVDGGSYGTISGQNLKLVNTNGDAQAFWIWAEAQGIKFQNRRLDHYAFISEDSGATWVSYQRWGGVITNNPFTAVEYGIECRGSFFIDSDIFPEKVLSQSNFPSIDASLVNKPERIALGFVERAEAIKLTSPVPVPLGFNSAGPFSQNGNKVFSVFSLAYITLPYQDPALVLNTQGATFAANQMRGFLLQAVNGGESVSVKGNDATTFITTQNGSQGITKVYLSAPLSTDDSITEDNYINNYAAPPFGQYKGFAARFMYTDITVAAGMTSWPASTTLYLIGETSGAASNLFHSASQFTATAFPIRRLYNIGERVYLSVQSKRTSSINNDGNLTILGFDGVIGFVKNVNTDINGHVFITITASGATNTLSIYKNNGYSSLVAHVSYTNIGTYSITADSGSGISGSITITNMATATSTNPSTGLWIALEGICDQVVAGNPCRAVLSSIRFLTPYNGNLTASISPTTLYFQAFQNELDYQASENAISEFVSVSASGPASYFDSENNEYLDLSSLIKFKDAGASNPYRSPFLSIASYQSATGTKFLIYSPIIPAGASLNIDSTPDPAAQYRMAAYVPQPVLVDLSRATYLSLDSTPQSNGAAFRGFYTKAFPSTEFFKKQYDNIYLLVDMSVLTDSLYAYSFNFQAFYYDALGNPLFTGTRNVFPFPLPGFPAVAGGAFIPNSVQNYLPNSYYDNGGDVNGEGSAFSLTYFDLSGVPTNTAARFLIPSSLIAGNAATLGFVLLHFGISTTGQKSPIQSTLTIRVKQVGFLGVNTVDLKTQAVYLRLIGEKNDDSLPVTDLFRAVGYFLQKDGLIASFADLPGNLNSPLLYTGSGEPLFPVGRQLTEQRTSKDWITEMCRQGWFCLFPDRKNKMTAVNWLIRNRPADISFADDSSTILQQVSQAGKDQAVKITLERTDWKRVYNNFTFDYHIDPNLGWRGVISISNASAAAFPGVYVSTNSGGDSTETFSSVIVVNEGGRWVAKVTSSLTGFNVGDIFSFYGSDIGVSVFFSPVTAKAVSGGNRIYSFDIGTAFSGIPGVSSSVGTWRLQGSAIPLWTTYVSGLPLGAQSWQTASDLWTPCHAAYVETLAIQDAPSNLTDMTWFIDKGIFYNDPNQQPLNTLAALNSAKNHAYWSTKQKDVIGYQIALTGATAQRELLKFGSFNDEIFTASITRHGWLTYIEDDVKTDTLKLKLMVNPDGQVAPTTIIESGNAVDQVVESGNRANNIVETGSA